MASVVRKEEITIAIVRVLSVSAFRARNPGNSPVFSLLHWLQQKMFSSWWQQPLLLLLFFFFILCFIICLQLDFGAVMTLWGYWANSAPIPQHPLFCLLRSALLLESTWAVLTPGSLPAWLRQSKAAAVKYFPVKYSFLVKVLRKVSWLLVKCRAASWGPLTSVFFCS